MTEPTQRRRRQPFVLLILNCQRYKDKALRQKNTWLKEIPTDLCYYHVQGNPDLPVDFVFKESESFLTVRSPDDYLSLPDKMVRALAAIHAVLDYDYVFKTDDDQRLKDASFFQDLMARLSPPRAAAHYGGNIIHVKQPYLSQYYRIHPELPTYLPILATRYCSGRFYFLSHHAVSDLLTKETREKIRQHCLEDYAIGYHLSERYKTPTALMSIATDAVFEDDL